MDDDALYMREAIIEARLAEARGEVPVGCVVVTNGLILGRGHNLRESLQDPTAHAEIVALREASAELGSWRLEDAHVYVTLEPCPMCAGALVNARVARVIYGSDDPKAGAVASLYNIGSDTRLNHRFLFRGGVLGDETSALLTDFFSRVRAARREREILADKERSTRGRSPSTQHLPAILTGDGESSPIVVAQRQAQLAETLVGTPSPSSRPPVPPPDPSRGGGQQGAD
ncbi:MAG: tRNA adenosine(34) deaminase TadA [Kofleriaceae bacterium]|nr:tRNA adenosine(34) deaminase TadA [Kofleriaceae bacterium]